MLQQIWQTTALLLVLLCCPCVGRAAETESVRIGIMPFNSIMALFKLHHPLRVHLEAALQHPIELYTGKDYQEFLNEALAGHFDIVIAGPHLAVIAISQGYQPLFQYTTRLQPVLVVKKNSSIRKAEDLKGKTIGLSSKLSVSSIGGIRWLRQHGLEPGPDVTLVERSTHGIAVAAVAHGELDAALTTHTPLKQISKEIQDQVDILPTGIELPHLMTLARTGLGPQKIARIRDALARFPDTEEGKAFFKDTGYLGYQPISAHELDALQPYIEITRQVLQQNQQR